MPVSRVVVDDVNPAHKYKANIKREVGSNGTGLEVKIKELWTN